MLIIRLLGELEVEADGVPVTPSSSRRAWALLAWFALHPGPRARGDVAARFWPDVLDTSARASLRSAVWALRRALGPAAAGRLAATRDRVGLVAGDDVWTDHAAFDGLVQDGRLEEAVALCRGPLLLGVDEEWAHPAREAHADRLSAVLAALAEAAHTRGDDVAAVEWARRRAALDPFGEAAQRDLMELLADTGDRPGALAVYARLTERLRGELALAPAAATRALVATVRAGAEVPAPRPIDRAAPSPVRRVPSDAAPLTGRHGELSACRAAWAQARSGRGTLVLMTGEGGIGKTRLAGELLDEAAADGARVAACGALDLGGSAPFGLWAELLGDLAGQLAPVPFTATWPEELARLVPSLPHRLGREGLASPAARGVPELDRARLFEAAVELVEHAACDRPLVLLFEDVHLADAPSLELAGYVGRRLAGLPVLLVLTRRAFPRRDEVDAMVHALRARHLDVGEVDPAPLTHAEMTALVRALSPLSALEVDRVVAQADGNPLLAVETARAAREPGEGPPPGLGAAVRAATSRLTPDGRRLAELAAVAGGDLELSELRALDAVDAVATALDCGLFASREGRFGFRHALLREVAYADLPEVHRAELHATFAAAVDRPAAERARHLRLAARDEEAVEQLARAADEAWSVTAIDEAAAFLHEAVELAPGDARLLQRLAETEAWRGRRAAADEAFARVLEHLDPYDAGALADAWMGRAAWMRGSLCDPRASREAARRGLELLQQGDAGPARLAEAMAILAWSEAVAGDASEAERLVAGIEALPPFAHTPVLEHEIAFAEGHILVSRGDVVGSYAPFAEAGGAIAGASRPDLAYAAWVNGACAAAAMGDFTRALDFADRGLASVAGIAPVELQCCAARAFILARLGRAAEARAAVARERELSMRIDDPAVSAMVEHDAGLVAFRLGDFGEAEARLADGLARGARVSRPHALLMRAEALAHLGRLDEAEAELRATALEPLAPADFPRALVPSLTRVQGVIAAARGDEALARRRFTEAAAAWRHMLDEDAAVNEAWFHTLVDFGRPPVAGLIEPAVELDRVLADLAALDAVPAP